VKDIAFISAAELTSFELAPDHPFKPLRSELTESLLLATGLLQESDRVEPGPLAETELLGIHRKDYVQAVKDVSHGVKRPDAYSYGLGTGDNPIFPRMHEAIMGICSATVTAVELVASGQARLAVNLSGGLHHAHAGQASGFCIYNDLALGIRRAVREHGLRVAYIDLDAHHGDGVQGLFYDDPRVLTLSLHESGRYIFPGSGHTYEIGEGAGRGLSVNAPLEPFTEDDSFLEVFESVVPAALEMFRPDLIVLQAGADMHHHDPLADMALTLEGMKKSYLRVSELAREYCGGRLVATGGGGYDAYRTVPRAWAQLVAVLAGRELPERLPDSWIRQWAARGITGLPETALDSPADFTAIARRASISAQNRAMLKRLHGALGPVWDSRKGIR
jgi:acetoin utilization protein AcuC